MTTRGRELVDTLKTELIADRVWSTKTKLGLAIFDPTRVMPAVER